MLQLKKGFLRTLSFLENDVRLQNQGIVTFSANTVHTSFVLLLWKIGLWPTFDILGGEKSYENTID